MSNIDPFRIMLEKRSRELDRNYLKDESLKKIKGIKK